ncbi:LETM1 domain-containing protein (plasmid) [Streptomyces sp. NBC_00536]|uniref:hypothetical protein n=1 Tax=Streptomyces sp. NBC_00536 TaxID=2975769 RepID=UPI002E813402|nr:hypothetical protein [Streptomyces sp. NBC_00536]WUC84342.1 LETM1 domain-containing protein [Streptomyces sp. NBC_00536]
MYPIEPESWPEGAVECTQVHWTVRDSWQRFQAARHDWDASHALGADLREAYRLLTMALEKLGYTVTYREKPDRWGTYEWIEVYAMAGQVTEPSAT